jgi:hypothetical protein
MPELINDNPKDWLQLYVDAMTEKDPYKRLAIVRQLRELPRHDESEELRDEPRARVRPSLQPESPDRPRVEVRSRKPKLVHKASRRHSRLRSA